MGIEQSNYNRIVWVLIMLLSIVLYIFSVVWFTHIREYALADVDYSQFQCIDDTASRIGH